MSHEASNVVASAAEPDSGRVALTAGQARRVLGIYIDLIGFCAKVTGKIGPAVESAVKHVRDKAIFKAVEVKA